jgi:hypothetical protein
VANVAHPELLDKSLQTVEGHLKALPPEDRLEVVRQLRSHVLDRVKGDVSGANVAAALATLGEPQEIARINLRMRMAATAVEHGTPLTVARTLARLAAFGGQGLLMFLLSLSGYAFAGCWLFTAFTKPFAPDRVGLWLLPSTSGDVSLSLGRHGAGVIGHDVLGWWIIPIGLTIGFVCAFATYRFDLRFIRRLASPQHPAGISSA